MKKCYFLFATVFLALFIQAQTVETFDNLELSGSSYRDGSFIGVNGIEWTYTQARASNAYSIDGKGIMLKSGTVSGTITGGVGTLSFEYRKAFTGQGNRIIELFVNGESVKITDPFGNFSGEDETIYTLSYDLNTDDDISIKIETNAAQTTIDNITWTPNDDLRISDIDLQKNILVKNTLVSDEIVFGDSAEIQIINMSGQLIKSAKVRKNVRMNVSSLTPGIYIVTAELNGKKVSQKIVKE